MFVRLATSDQGGQIRDVVAIFYDNNKSTGRPSVIVDYVAQSDDTSFSASHFSNIS